MADKQAKPDSKSDKITNVNEPVPGPELGRQLKETEAKVKSSEAPQGESDLVKAQRQAKEQASVAAQEKAELEQRLKQDKIVEQSQRLEGKSLDKELKLVISSLRRGGASNEEGKYFARVIEKKLGL